MTDWLDEHLETFVKPYLGSVPDVVAHDDWLGDKYSYGSPPCSLTPRVLQELKMFWTRGKALSKGKPILFPGRDAWLLHVLASMEGYPTLFRPELSRSVATANVVDCSQFAGCFIIDCGTNGTIPCALGIKDFALTTSPYVKHRLLPVEEHDSPTYRFMMYHAKYWTHAEIKGNVPVQDFTQTWEFTRCCQLTQHFVEIACAPRKKTMVLITPQGSP